MIKMINFNFDLVSSTSLLGNMFFASTIFITLVIARYATLAKLIRDSRGAIENGDLKFNDRNEYLFHIQHYEKRLRLLKTTLYLALFGGVALCASMFFLLLHFDLIGLFIFGLHLILILSGLVSLVIELAVSFEALTEHLDILKSWNRF